MAVALHVEQCLGDEVTLSSVLFSPGRLLAVVKK